MTTFSQTAASAVAERKWYLVDANNKTLGRLATAIAMRLCGKHKPEYTRHIDTGDYIVVVNADKIHVTGNKMKDKVYYHHTGYQGGLKEITLEKLLTKAPEQILKLAVKGMLPKGPLGRKMLSKLKVYGCEKHPHQAQLLQSLEI